MIQKMITRRIGINCSPQGCFHLQGGVAKWQYQQEELLKRKKAKRRTHYKLTINGLNECANCGEMKKATMYAQTVVITMEKM